MVPVIIQAILIKLFQQNLTWEILVEKTWQYHFAHCHVFLMSIACKQCNRIWYRMENFVGIEVLVKTGRGIKHIQASQLRTTRNILKTTYGELLE